MKTLAQSLYLLMTIIFGMNIAWLLYYWNAHETILFANFEIPKVLYLVLQLIFLALFASRYLKIVKENQDQNKI